MKTIDDSSSSNLSSLNSSISSVSTASYTNKSSFASSRPSHHHHHHHHRRSSVNSSTIATDVSLRRKLKDADDPNTTNTSFISEDCPATGRSSRFDHASQVSSAAAASSSSAAKRSRSANDLSSVRSKVSLIKGDPSERFVF